MPNDMIGLMMLSCRNCRSPQRPNIIIVTCQINNDIENAMIKPLGIIFAGLFSDPVYEKHPVNDVKPGDTV